MLERETEGYSARVAEAAVDDSALELLLRNGRYCVGCHPEEDIYPFEEMKVRVPLFWKTRGGPVILLPGALIGAQVFYRRTKTIPSQDNMVEEWSLHISRDGVNSVYNTTVEGNCNELERQFS